MQKVRVDYLTKHMERVPELAKLWVDVLGSVHVPEVSAQEVESWLLAWHNEKRVPLGLIALESHDAVGFCGLNQSDGIRKELSPWLTDLCVKKDKQNLGVGRVLVSETKRIARELGNKNLYLLTFERQLISYYSDCGFEIMGEDILRKKLVYVMHAQL
jgi:GNAT superfamily N-acetyltransferase